MVRLVIETQSRPLWRHRNVRNDTHRVPSCHISTFLRPFQYFSAHYIFQIITVDFLALDVYILCPLHFLVIVFTSWQLCLRFLIITLRFPLHLRFQTTTFMVLSIIAAVFSVGIIVIAAIGMHESSESYHPYRHYIYMYEEDYSYYKAQVSRICLLSCHGNASRIIGPL